MRMNTNHLQAILKHNRLHLINPFMPDAETRSRATDIGAVVTTRARARIKAQADRLPRAGLAETLQLTQGAGIDLNPQLVKFCKISRQLLRAQTDIRCWHAGGNGTTYLMPRASVNL